MPSCPEIPHQHPLFPWVARLPLLRNRLAAAGFGTGPDRWLNLHDLLFRLYQEDRLPSEIRELRKFIRPLFCRNPEESRTFDACFDAWVDEGRRDDGLPAAEPTASPYAEPAIPPPPGTPPLRPFRRWPLVVLVVLLPLVFLVSGYLLLKPVESPIPATPTAPLLESLKLLPWLGIPITLAWLIWIWRRRRYVLRRAPDSGRDPLASLAIYADSHPLFAAPPVQDALRRLHRPIETPVRALDIKATVAASIRRAGFFQPIRRDRRFVPEVLILIDTRDPKDLLADLGRLVAERLRQQGHEVFVYTYQGAPNGFVDTTSRIEPAGVEGLFHHHPQARLLLIGDPTALLTNLGTHLTAAASDLTRWPWRGLLSTRDPDQAWIGVLTAAGFYVEPLTSEGIRAISAQLAELPQPTVTWQRSFSPPAPFRDRHTLLWRWRPRFREFRTDLAALRRYLGEDGYFLLTAMAVYPALHWGLTQVLDSRLFPDDTSERREQRLVKLAQLAWSRIGWLPEWFRIYLLRRLPRRELRAIRREFCTLLDPPVAAIDGGTIQLPFRVPKRRPRCKGGWRDWLEGLIARAPEHSRLKDAVFANLMLGGRLGLLDFTLPRWLGRRLPDGDWQSFLGPLLKAGAGVLLFWLVATGLWQVDSVRTEIGNWVVAHWVATDQGQTFAILADAWNKVLSKALQPILALLEQKAWGLSWEQILNLPVTPGLIGGFVGSFLVLAAGHFVAVGFPEPPSKWSWGKKVLFLIAGTLLGAFLSLLIAIESEPHLWTFICGNLRNLRIEWEKQILSQSRERGSQGILGIPSACRKVPIIDGHASLLCIRSSNRGPETFVE